MNPRHLTDEALDAYERYLKEEERAPATVQKYRRDLRRFAREVQEEAITKERIVRYKNGLLERYAAASVNSVLAAVNGFLAFAGWHECRVRPVKVQRSIYRDARRELTQQEYYRLLTAAKERGNQRLYCLLQTICSTGIRVSELRFVTVRAARQGWTEVRNKGKSRAVFLPHRLCAQLLQYCRQRHIAAGRIFITRTGAPLDRSNIWAMMKSLCKYAGVPPAKVFPHNLRHLFARAFYKKEKDIDHLAAILGHSSVDTTRIYTKTTGAEHRRQIELLHLVI